MKRILFKMTSTYSGIFPHLFYSPFTFYISSWFVERYICSFFVGKTHSRVFWEKELSIDSTTHYHFSNPTFCLYSPLNLVSAIFYDSM